jgi:hypothetical protein
MVPLAEEAEAEAEAVVAVEVVAEAARVESSVTAGAVTVPAAAGEVVAEEATGK